MKVSIRSLIWVFLVFTAGFAAAACFVVLQARKDIENELSSARYVAQSLAQLIEADRVSAQTSQQLRFRHIRISSQPPRLVGRNLNSDMPNWLIALSTSRVDRSIHIHPVRLDPVQTWSVYATPEDELNEVWNTLTVTFMIFLLSALVCVLLIQTGIHDALKHLRQLSQGMQDMQHGNLNTVLAETSPIHELKSIAQQYNATARALSEAREENKNLSISLINSQEQERRRLGAELHDNLGQIVSGLRARTYLLKVQLKNDVHASVQEIFNSMAEDLEEAHRVIRHLINELDPVDIQTIDLRSKLEQTCKQWTQATGIECKLIALLPDNMSAVFSATETIHIIRIVQESLHNIHKHSNANRVHLSAISSAEFFDLRIEDNGTNNNGVKAGYGMRSMKERARALNAQLRIQKPAGRGMLLHLHKPHNLELQNELSDC